MKIKKILVHLMSECGELTQAAAKLYQYGPESNDRGSIPKTNRVALEEEAGDVLALIDLLIDAGVIRSDRLQDRTIDKTKFYRGKYA